MPCPLTAHALRRRFVRTLISGACLIGTAYANPPAPAADEANVDVRRDPLFLRLDINRDQRISRSEAARLPEFLAPFDAADENRDGFLSPEEFKRARLIQERIRSAQFLSDGIITARVRSRLQRHDELQSAPIQVETRDGRVSLTGSVEKAEQRLQAERVAASVAGVTAVKNSIEIRTLPAAVPAGASRVASP